ncbi:hypothetical protein ACQR9Q_23710, partial [Klebsiella pneumoniae]
PTRRTHNANTPRFFYPSARSWQAICAAARDVGLSESHFDRCRPLA